jgi:4-hydroxybenzoate polyprenyltransferase
LKTNWFISNPVVKTLVYANVFIALCALSQVFLTYHLFSIPFTFATNSYLLFILLSTYLQYNVQRGYMINQNNVHEERSQWLIRHKKTALISVGLSLLIVLFLCNNLSWTSIGIMIGAEVVSTLYYLQPFNLRRHGYIKPFLISSVWAISCCLVPLIENKLVTEHSIWFVASQFCFISVLCLLFDIKDGESDYLSGVNTYANKFGVKITKVICLVFMALGFTCFYLFNHEAHFLITSIILRLFILATILFTNERKHSFYFYLWVDGLLLLQTILFLF